MHSSVRIYFSEFFATFALVFCGTGAIVINQISGGAITHSGVAIVFGLIVMAMIYSFGRISGAHMNPAVTIAFSLLGVFSKRQIFPYLIMQFSGAIAASLILKVLFPNHATLGATIPAGTAMQSFILEFLLSFILMMVILHVAHGAREEGLMAGISIGAVVLLEAMFAGPVSGASMNPFRSLAPAMVSGNTSEVWIYLVSPTIAMLTAVVIYKFLNQSTQENVSDTTRDHR